MEKSNQPNKIKTLPSRMAVGGMPRPLALLQGLLWAAALLGLGSLLLAAAYTQTDLSRPTMHLLQQVILGLACMVGAWRTARLAGRKGLFNGLLLAVLLLIMLAAVNIAAAGGVHIGLPLLVKAVILTAGGALGGMLGVL
ncbi:MAG: TIGR04086 family membrane protein [Firmicutes bacterium]|nr:TIGR04086 family membrane protein [Bacillota bacterium]MBQ3199139.1 TIGR04086 family membrane protein [Bacillota bacterium]